MISAAHLSPPDDQNVQHVSVVEFSTMSSRRRRGSLSILPLNCLVMYGALAPEVEASLLKTCLTNLAVIACAKDHIFRNLHGNCLDIY